MNARPRVLVVDDDTAVLRFLGEALASLGLEPHCVEARQFSPQLLDAETYQAVVLDWQMPELSGTDIARQVRRSSLNAASPIVMLTGYPSPELMQESLQAGVNFFLPKPVSLRQLRNLLDPQHGFALHERRHLQREPVLIPVTCRWKDRSVSAQALNMNSEGARLAMAEAPPMHGWVSLAFDAPGRAQPLELTGQVIRVTFRAGAGLGAAPREVGVRFVGLPRDAADWLNHSGQKLRSAPNN